MVVENMGMEGRRLHGVREALRGLRFVNRVTRGGSSAMEDEMMLGEVERRFQRLAKEGLLLREDFAECIGMEDSREFATRVFDALSRRRGQSLQRITKEELHDYWLHISDPSFGARLQTFFDMVDANLDGRITREEVQELIELSASANKLRRLKDQAQEYAALIMEELDPEDRGYIELWQLEALHLQRDRYVGLSPGGLSRKGDGGLFRRARRRVRCLILERWRRTWVLLLWSTIMAGLFAWKFLRYRRSAAFHVFGYCLPTAKGAAETLKLNMALVLLPVCRNSITWLRSTVARRLVPFDDNILFHKVIATSIASGVLLHAGNHLACDFPRLAKATPPKYAIVAGDFGPRRPTLAGLITGIEGVTGIAMVALMAVAYTLATDRFRNDGVRLLPPPLNKLAGFNAFWYSHHLFAIVYVLLLLHGYFLFLVHRWYRKTTWMYISLPLLLYLGERSLRALRSEVYTVKIIKATILPGQVLTISMSKPHGFRYRSGQYLFLKCPSVSPFECFPRLLVDGPYGAPAQNYRNYDVVLLVGLGIGATPFISILRDLLNSIKTTQGPLVEFAFLFTTWWGTSNIPYTIPSIRIRVADASRSTDIASAASCRSGLVGGSRRRTQRTRNAYFYWVTREAGSLEWFKGVMDEVAEMDHKGAIEMHNHLTSVYEEGDARAALLTMIQALNHAKNGIDVVSGTRVRTHFGRPNWKEVFARIATKHPRATAGVFYCGMSALAKDLGRLCREFNLRSETRFVFHKEYL